MLQYTVLRDRGLATIVCLMASWSINAMKVWNVCSWRSWLIWDFTFQTTAKTYPASNVCSSWSWQNICFYRPHCNIRKITTESKFHCYILERNVSVSFLTKSLERRSTGINSISVNTKNKFATNHFLQWFRSSGNLTVMRSFLRSHVSEIVFKFDLTFFSSRMMLTLFYVLLQWS